MWPNRQFPADLVTFTEEILNGKLHFLCSVFCQSLCPVSYIGRWVTLFMRSNWESSDWDLTRFFIYEIWVPWRGLRPIIEFLNFNTGVVEERSLSNTESTANSYSKFCFFATKYICANVFHFPFFVYCWIMKLLLLVLIASWLDIRNLGP